MEATAGGIEDVDNRSVSSLTTLPISNRSKVSPDIVTDKVPHIPDEQDVDTVDTDPSHTVGSGHKSDLASDQSTEHLDEDLQEQVRQAQEQVRRAQEQLRQASNAVKEARKEARKQQRKRNLAKHYDAKKNTRKRRDDDDGDQGGNSDPKPPPVAPAAVATK